MKKWMKRLATVAVSIAIGVIATSIYYESTKPKTVISALAAKDYAFVPSFSADDIFNRVNEYRVSQGLKPLNKDPLLCETAKEKAVDMVDNDYFDHYTGKRYDNLINAQYRRYRMIGENLAVTNETADTVVAGWINSPTHQENILGGYTSSCVAQEVDQRSHTVKIVQHFIAL